jgi:hypothetical protein
MSHTVRVKSREYYEVGDQLILKVDISGRERRLNVHIPLAAIENRKAVYGLATDEEAITAILKEHATRELSLGDDSHANARIARMGGLRQDVEIEREDKEIDE